MNLRRWIPLLIVLAGIVAYHNSLDGKFVFDDHGSIIENQRIQRLLPLSNTLGGTARPIVQLSLALNYATSELNPWDYHVFNLIVHLMAGLMLYGVLRRTFMGVRKDCGRETVDCGLATGGTRAIASSTDTDIIGQALSDEAGPRLASQADNESEATGTVALQNVEKQRPRGTVALQDQVSGQWSVVCSQDREAVLAGIIALIWVVHPLNTQAVTYIIQRGESMMGLFYMLTLYCFIRGVEADADRNGESERGSVGVLSKGESGNPPLHHSTPPSLRRSVHGPQSTVHIPRFRCTLWFAMAIAACTAGMLCKEVMVTAPFLVLVYDWLFVGRSWRSMWHTRKIFYLFLISTSIIPVLLVLRYLPEDHASAGFGIKHVTWWQYALTQPEVILHYLRLSIWPSGLCLDYLWPKAGGFWQITPPFLVVLGMVALTLYFFHRSHALAFLGCWFLGVLSVTSSIMPIADMAMEHRMYLPLAAVVAVLVLGGYRLIVFAEKQRKSLIGVVRAAGCLLVAAIVVSLTTGTINRNKDYHDPFVLWQKVAAQRPWQPRAQIQMGIVLLNNGMAAESMPYFEKAISMVPHNAAGYQFLGGAYAMLGQHRKSIRLYEQAVEKGAIDARTQINIASQYELLGQMDVALLYYREAVRLDPNNAHNQLYLAVALGTTKNTAEACHHFDRALTLRRWDPAFHFYFGQFLFGERQYQKAVFHYEKACSLTNAPSVHYLNALGTAYAETGRFTEAIGVSQKALAVAQQSGKYNWVQEVHRRLALYRQGKAISNDK